MYCAGKRDLEDFPRPATCGDVNHRPRPVHWPLAYFITPHGFGHAARACAVLEALAGRCPHLRPELFTTVPRWFFEESLGRVFGYHPCPCDLGLVQTSSLHEDLLATARRLREQLPYPAALVEQLASTVRALGCRAVVCDVSALGVAVAERAGLPSVVVENFTWDWVYAAYAGHDRAFGAAADYLAKLLRGATRRVQTEPECAPVGGALRVPPVWRQPRCLPGEIRRRLAIPASQPLILLTMGGVPWHWDGVGRLVDYGEAVFVVPGGAGEERRQGNLLLLPHRTGFFHPDLVRAADVVVGKLGYSTVAEVVGMGKPFAYIPRPTFPESPVLQAFLLRRGGCLAIAPERFSTCEWVDGAAELTSAALPPAPASGADAVAAAILEISV